MIGGIDTEIHSEGGLFTTRDFDPRCAEAPPVRGDDVAWTRL